MGFGLPIFGDIAGGIASSIANFAGQRETNRNSITLAKEQMDWQARMSGSAHQREVADLKAAGLNPILSAGGNGASTPSGSSPNLAAPTIAFPQVMSMFMGVEQLRQSDERLKLDQAQTAAGIANTMSDTEVNKAKKILMQKGLIGAELGAEGSQLLKKGIEKLKEQFNLNQPPKVWNKTKLNGGSQRIP